VRAAAHLTHCLGVCHRVGKPGWGQEAPSRRRRQGRPAAAFRQRGRRLRSPLNHQHQLRNHHPHRDLQPHRQPHRRQPEGPPTPGQLKDYPAEGSKQVSDPCGRVGPGRASKGRPTPPFLSPARPSIRASISSLSASTRESNCPEAASYGAEGSRQLSGWVGA
jgi:hypothetical protein